MKKILQNLAYKWLKKTGYNFPLPVINTTIIPQDLKRFHAQHIVPNHEWLLRQVEPDCFIRQFKDQVADELLKEIKIKFERTPDGVLFSADFLYKNLNSNEFKE